MNGDVIVNYEDYNSNTIKDIVIGLFRSTNFKISDVKGENKIILSMYDTISDNTEVSGEIDLEKLNVLMKALNNIKRQKEYESERNETKEWLLIEIWKYKIMSIR